MAKIKPEFDKRGVKITSSSQARCRNNNAKKQYPQGWKAPKAYLRIVPQAK